MSIGLLDQCLSEFDREMGATRRVLLRVPDDRLSWRPHPRSMTLGRLATHVAEIPGWAQGVRMALLNLGVRARLLGEVDKAVAFFEEGRALSEAAGDSYALGFYLTNLAHGLKNVPSTVESLKDPQLQNDQHFKPFLDIFANEQSTFKPITPIGITDFALFQSFAQKWQAGQVPNLQAGLQQVDSQIAKQLQLG